MTRQEFRRKYDFLRYRPQTQEYRKSKRELCERANDPALLKFALSSSPESRERMRKYNGSSKKMETKQHTHRGVKFLTGNSHFSAGDYGYLILWNNDKGQWKFDGYGNRIRARKAAEKEIDDQIEKGFIQ